MIENFGMDFLFHDDQFLSPVNAFTISLTENEERSRQSGDALAFGVLACESSP
jgi:hypothetical protein